MGEIGFRQTCQRVILSGATLFNGGASATLTLTGSIPSGQDFAIRATASHAGTVSIVGELDGEAVSEVMTFTFARWRKTSHTFDTITAITTTDMDGEDLHIEAVDTLGNPITTESLVDVTCRWEGKQEKYVDENGDDRRGNAKVITSELIDVGETLIYGGRRYEVVLIKPAVRLGGSERFRTLILI